MQVSNLTGIVLGGPADFIGLTAVVAALLIPIIAILVRHQQIMAEIYRGSKTRDSKPNGIEALKN